MAQHLIDFINWLTSWVGIQLWPALVETLAYTIAGLIHIALILNLVAVGALFFIWLERKISGRIQDRLGPTRVGGKFGWLQTLADGIKLLTKEDLMPGGADGFLFKIAPYVSFCAAISAFIAIPFAGGDYPWIAQRLNTGVFFVLAVLGLEVFGVILAGYSSASKWSLFGAMRCAANAVSMSAAQRSRSATVAGIRRTISLRVSAGGRVGAGGAVTQPASSSASHGAMWRNGRQVAGRVMRAAYEARRPDAPACSAAVGRHG